MAAALAVGTADVSTVSAYREGPPPGFAGGFGESSCGACHFSWSDDEGPGQLVVEGVPERYRPGETYPLVVRLAREGMALSGFELTARFRADGIQAGVLAPAPGDEARAAVIVDRQVQYAFQLDAGAEPLVQDTAWWRLLWTAPAGRGAVQVHVAANAADGDGTAEGDEVYTAELTILPEE